MPTHMRTLFSVGELRKAEAVSGDTFSFTKGCPVWKIPKGNGSGDRDFSDLLINGKDSEEARHIDNNSLVNAANFGDLLFDMSVDPRQESPLKDPELEVRLANLMKRAMKENECPPEQFERIGLPGADDTGITAEDIRRLHEKDENKTEPLILPELAWTRGAVNTYRALLRFIPEERKAKAADVLAREIWEAVSGDSASAVRAGETVTARTVLNCIPAVVPAEYVEMVEYFVDLAGRTS